MSNTPKAPWKTTLKNNVQFEPQSHAHLLEDFDGFTIGFLSSWINDPETKLEAEANVRLITAAPELLHALQYALPSLGHEEREVAEEAIAKATGVAP